MSSQRPRVRLVHWNEPEAAERVARLRAAGFDAAGDLPEPPAFLRRLREERPAAVVIDLGRVPSHGRDLAAAIRAQKATRGIPLVFVGGDPGKVEGVRALLPDATWSGLLFTRRRG
jgi:DNA-binding response OmpR family regulator